MQDIADFSRKRGSRDRKKRDSRSDKGKRRLLTQLAAATGVSALMSAPFLLADKSVGNTTKPKKSYASDKISDRNLAKMFGIDIPISPEEQEKAKKAFQDDLDKEANRNAAYQAKRAAPPQQGLYLDDPAIDAKYKNPRIARRQQNFQQILKGREGMDLATDITALGNKKVRQSMSKVDRKALLKKVASKLVGLRKTGKFSKQYYSLADFSRKTGSKDRQPRLRKKPQLLGERLTTKVRKFAIPSAAIGGVAGLVTGRGNLRYAAKSAASGGAIGAGLGATTWGLGARSPIPGIRNWQRRRNSG